MSYSLPCVGGGGGAGGLHLGVIPRPFGPIWTRRVGCCKNRGHRLGAGCCPVGAPETRPWAPCLPDPVLHLLKSRLSRHRPYLVRTQALSRVLG